MAHEHQDPHSNKLVHEMVKKVYRKRLPVIIGADANAYHTLLAISNTNQRGECILNFISNHNLAILNRGSTPTFVVSNRIEVLDITIINAGLMDLIENWRVSNDSSFSDPRYLEFSLRKKPNKCESFINRRKTRSEEQYSILTNLLGIKPTISSIEEIEEDVSKFPLWMENLSWIC